MRKSRAQIYDELLVLKCQAGLQFNNPDEALVLGCSYKNQSSKGAKAVAASDCGAIGQRTSG